MNENQQMVSDCEERESRLSEWESDFISSISERLDIGYSLTVKQSLKLVNIWEKATEKG